MSIGKDIFELMNAIGYTFSDVTYLEVALTHSSYTNEMRNKGIRAESNEALEFLGDAVLEIVISELLFDKYKRMGEGALTRMRQSLVCEATLCKIAGDLSLGDYLNIGTAEEGIGLRCLPKILADALEALIAAVYLDDRENGKGILYPSVIQNLFSKEFDSVAKKRPQDHKTQLQQFVEKNGDSDLRYTYSESGPEHNKTFTAYAYINNNMVGEGTGKTKRAAEMNAARVALSLFGIIKDE